MDDIVVHFGSGNPVKVQLLGEVPGHFFFRENSYVKLIFFRPFYSQNCGLRVYLSHWRLRRQESLFCNSTQCHPLPVPAHKGRTWRCYTQYLLDTKPHLRSGSAKEMCSLPKIHITFNNCNTQFEDKCQIFVKQNGSACRVGDLAHRPPTLSKIWNWALKSHLPQYENVKIFRYLSNFVPTARVQFICVIARRRRMLAFLSFCKMQSCHSQKQREQH